jgi:choice-of-anchor C domain-containing protein
VTVAANGRLALEALASSGPFDVILMDVQMPVMDGPTAARAIRALEAASGLGRIPIVALTANVMSHQLEAYLAAGMDGFVAKPIAVTELYAAIDRAAAAPLATPPSRRPEAPGTDLASREAIFQPLCRSGIMTFKTTLLAAACAAALVIAGSAGAATIANGGFVGPDAPNGGFQTVGVSTDVIPGWTVASGDVDWIQGYWQSSDGDGFSVDLNGNHPGAISQTIDTVIGQTYTLTFDMSANPDHGNDLRLILADTGGAPTTFAYNLDVSANSRSNMNWTPQSLNFTATGASTTITFASGNGGDNCCFGAAIDNVAIANAVPEPASWALMLAGFLGAGTALRRSRRLVAAAA